MIPSVDETRKTQFNYKIFYLSSTKIWFYGWLDNKFCLWIVKATLTVGSEEERILFSLLFFLCSKHISRYENDSIIIDVMMRRFCDVY